MIKIFQVLRKPPRPAPLTLEQKLIRREARIGGRLFGAVPPGHHREFFCLDENTWIWHEDRLDDNGNRQQIITRYDIYADGVYKRQNNEIEYRQLTASETANLDQAINLYQQAVSDIYRPPASDSPVSVTPGQSKHQ